MADPVEIIETYTYADYLTWPESLRCELIGGVVYMMASPSLWHQDMVLALGTQIFDFLKGKKCKVITSPFDVRLFPDEENKDINVIIPDLLVVCNEKKISDGKACRGAPDFIIEILSPGTEKRDLHVKKLLYAQAGVKECWFINRDTLYKCSLENGSFIEHTIYYLFDKEPVPVEAVPGLELSIPANL